MLVACWRVLDAAALTLPKEPTRFRDCEALDQARGMVSPSRPAWTLTLGQSTGMGCKSVLITSLSDSALYVAMFPPRTTRRRLQPLGRIALDTRNCSAAPHF